MGIMIHQTLLNQNITINSMNLLLYLKMVISTNIKDYTKFELCESQGKEIHKFKRFGGEKIGVSDIKTIENEINEVKNKYHVNLVNELLELTKSYSNHINNPLYVTKIENKINQIKEII